MIQKIYNYWFQYLTLNFILLLSIYFLEISSILSLLIILLLFLTFTVYLFVKSFLKKNDIVRKINYFFINLIILTITTLSILFIPYCFNKIYIQTINPMEKLEYFVNNKTYLETQSEKYLWDSTKFQKYSNIKIISKLHSCDFKNPPYFENEFCIDVLVDNQKDVLTWEYQWHDFKLVSKITIISNNYKLEALPDN